MSNKIKIAKIQTGLVDSDENIFFNMTACTDGLDPFTWIPYEDAIEIYDSIEYSHFKENEDDQDEPSEFILLNYIEEGLKPYKFLFTFEIDEVVWKNIKKISKKNGWDDQNEYIDYVITDFDWNHERENEVHVSENLIKLFDNFNFIQENKERLSVLFMQFIGETGNEDNLSQTEFEMFMAENSRDIVNSQLN